LPESINKSNQGTWIRMKGGKVLITVKANRNKVENVLLSILWCVEPIKIEHDSSKGAKIKEWGSVEVFEHQSAEYGGLKHSF